MTGDLAHVMERPGPFDSGSCPYETRRRFLKGVLAGATVAIVGATGFSGKVVASPEIMATGGTSGTQQGTLSVGRLKTATENLAVFTASERDQTHAMFNNTWGDPNGPHEAMIAAQWSPDKFQAMAVWDWPAWEHPYGHAWHSIYHGLDNAAKDQTGAKVNTDRRFPFPISKYTALTLDIPNVYVVGDGKWGLAFDMFLLPQFPPWTSDNQEIFIALKRHGYPTPLPELGSLTSCGVTYGYGKWDNPRNNFFWRKDDPAVPFRQQINIYDFINFLKARGIAQDTNLLLGVYFGVEPIEGSGTWRIDSFYTTLS